MAYSRHDLTIEINEVIEERLAAGSDVIVPWLIQAILASHEEVGLSDFSVCARMEFVADEVGRCVRRFKEPTPDELEELTLPGFKHLQRAYKFERGGQTTIIPIEAMTDEELEAKADEHDKMARGHLGHAREIRRYLKARKSMRGAA